MVKKRAAQRSDAEWDRLVDEWGSSGQKQSDFAAERGINPSTFQRHVWESRKRRSLTVRGRGKPCGFVEVTPASAPDSSVRGECRITMSNTQIEFSSSSDAAWIAEILSRLGHRK